jgi:hypothetical protein
LGEEVEGVGFLSWVKKSKVQTSHRRGRSLWLSPKVEGEEDSSLPLSFSFCFWLPPKVKGRRTYLFSIGFAETEGAGFSPGVKKPKAAGKRDLGEARPIIHPSTKKGFL